MDKFSRRTALFVLWFIIVSLQIPKTIGQEGQQDEEKQPYFQKTLQDTISMFQDTVSVLQKSQQAAWEKMKNIISDMQMQFSPPNLESEADKNDESHGMGEKMKEAAQKSFETSKHTVEETAKTAADAVGGTVYKTAEKVKETVSSDESTAEL